MFLLEPRHDRIRRRGPAYGFGYRTLVHDRKLRRNFRRDFKAPVGGFITVSPISGNAPLPVTIVATVNTTKSCAGAIYNLNFGDGSPVQQIPVAAGNCGEFNQTYQHTYQYGGGYIIKLFTAGHETSATVTVAGPSPPVFTSGLPRESFNVSPTSGSVPLTVTFSGTVNSNDAGFCAGGCASVLDFGDGTSASIDLPANVGGWLDYSVTHTYTKSGGFKTTLYQGGAGASQPTVGVFTIVVNPASTVSSTSGSYSYNKPTVASSDTNALAFTLSFNLPSACTGYRVSWVTGVRIVSKPMEALHARKQLFSSCCHTRTRKEARTPSR